MNEVYHVDSVFVHGDWNIVMGIVNDLLEGNAVVSVKRYVDGRYIATFYFTHAK